MLCYAGGTRQEVAHLQFTIHACETSCWSWAPQTWPASLSTPLSPQAPPRPWCPTSGLAIQTAEPSLTQPPLPQQVRGKPCKQQSHRPLTPSRLPSLPSAPQPPVCQINELTRLATEYIVHQHACMQAQQSNEARHLRCMCNPVLYRQALFTARTQPPIFGYLGAPSTYVCCLQDMQQTLLLLAVKPLQLAHNLSAVVCRRPLAAGLWQLV